MQIKFLCVGKTEEAWLQQGMTIYLKRLKHYIPFELIEVAIPKKWNSLPPQQLMERESEALLPYTKQSDQVILLDERGKMYRSVEFSALIQQQMNRSTKSLLFIAGGAWGFSPSLYDAAHAQLSLSPMTFSHQMVRLFFVEQLYRAMTIMRNESYHNE